MPRHTLFGLLDLFLHASACLPSCPGIVSSDAPCHGIMHSMLRHTIHYQFLHPHMPWHAPLHAWFCQILISTHAMACNPLCLGMLLTFLFFDRFESFSSPFDSKARIIIYKIKDHVKMSKMIIKLTKFLSIAALKYIYF